MKRELNKWQLVWHFPTIAIRDEMGWRDVLVGVIKLKAFPTEGTQISKRYYDGKLWHFYLWLTWEKA